jgi:uncharacterized membrane protein
MQESSNMSPLDLPRKIYLVIAIIGIGDVIYLSYEYLTLNFSSCSSKSNPFFSCATVAFSGHTSLLGRAGFL